MPRKEWNSESFWNETCNCRHWGWRAFGISISALWAIFSIITCIIAIGALVASLKSYDAAQKSYKVSQESYNISVLSAGGEENFGRMNKVYESEAYVEYATNQTEQAEAYFGLGEDDSTIDTDEVDTDEVDTEEINSTSPEDIKTIVEGMLASSPIRGDKDARFTIVEYTELHCPYCQRHSQAGTINSVMEQFPGEVNSISRHFIIHGEDALNLAAAMECVAELKPEVYHETFDKAFEAYPVDMDGLIGIATELGVDEAALKTCTDEGRYVQSVNDMMSQGSQLFGVNWTPGNVIIDRETGKYKLVSGAYPVDEFVKAINELKGN